MVGDEGYSPWPVVVEVRKGYFILCSDGVPEYDLVDVVEFVPIFIKITEVSIKGLEFGATRNGYV